MGFILKLPFYVIHYTNNSNETAISQALADNRPKISQTLWCSTSHMNVRKQQEFLPCTMAFFYMLLVFNRFREVQQFPVSVLLHWPVIVKGTLLSWLQFLNFVHHSAFWKSTSFPSSSERVERHLWVWCVELFQSLGQGPVGAASSFHLRTETALVSETLSSFRILDNGQCLEAK
jgi:hypothetical protein